MTNADTLFRSLIIYGICLPLAIFVGYLLADPTDIVTFASVGLLLSLFMFPVLLRWHFQWLVVAWNSTAGLYFLPGKPTLALAMIAASFSVSMLSYIMNRNLKFISVPSVTWPLLFIAAVALGTASLTGGIGLNVLGSSGVGGKRYIFLLACIVGYFALTARRIPLEKSNFYVNLFFLGGLSSVVGHLAAVVSPSFYFIFLIFPADTAGMASASPTAGTQITRMGGLAVTSVGVICWLLARYGVGGLMDAKRRWPLFAFIVFFVACMFGGFRGMLITLCLLSALLFFMEGLLHSRLLPVLLLGVILTVAIVVPFANKLPLPVQRSLTFLPLNLDMEAEMSAKESTGWRLEMWAEVLPTVPRYLILGKGLGIDANELDMMSRGMNAGEIGAAGSELAGDYHNGPLSLIIPFGLFGVAGFIWFLVAGLRVLHRNYRFGDPSQVRINRFLFAYFIVRIIIFFLIFGSFTGDMLYFVGLVGFSIALNGGVRGPVTAPVVRQTFRRFKLAEATQ